MESQEISLSVGSNGINRAGYLPKGAREMEAEMNNSCMVENAPKVHFEKNQLMHLITIIPDNSFQFCFTGLCSSMLSASSTLYYFISYLNPSQPSRQLHRWNFLWLPQVKVIQLTFVSFQYVSYLLFRASAILYDIWISYVCFLPLNVKQHVKTKTDFNRNFYSHSVQNS